MKKFSANVWVGVFFIVFSALVQFVVIPAHISVPGNVPMATMSPQYWPRFVCGLMMFLGTLQVVMSLFEAGSGKQPAAQAVTREDAAKVMGIILLLFCYYAAVRYVGFLIATMAFVPVMAFVYGERRIASLALLCAIPGPLLYLFFSRVAYTTFEPGILFL